jgi:Na+/phosphate symporter
MIKISGASFMKIALQFFRKINAPYKLVVINEENMSETMSIHLTKKSVYILFSSLFVMMFLLFSAIILFTPLKYYIPGNNQNVSRAKMLSVQRLADSLQIINQKREQYLFNLITIANGRVSTVSDTTRLSAAEIEQANRQNDQKIDKAHKYDYLKSIHKDSAKTEEPVNKDSIKLGK